MQHTSTSMCQVCRVKSKYYDAGTGKLHPYCGRTCASKAPNVATALCDYCKQHPKVVAPYCSKTCATAAKREKSETCSLTGCTKRSTRYSAGSYWNYCSPGHEELALRGCIYCRAVPFIGDYFPMCASCDTYLVDNAGPFILSVPQDHTTYWAVKDQFEAAWAHPTKVPEVRMVYRIIPAPSVWDHYWAYRDRLEAKGQFAAQGKYPGNEYLLWHGTTRACNLGEPGQHVFCTDSACSLCSIAQGSFNMANARTGRWQRYGPGIYISSKSSKSNSYVVNKNKSPWKAMLLNNVLAGVEYTTQLNGTSFRAPPQGYDSVYGKPGRDLNYDELVVYTDHAIRPAYLVMYE